VVQLGLGLTAVLVQLGLGLTAVQCKVELYKERKMLYTVL